MSTRKAAPDPGYDNKGNRVHWTDIMNPGSEAEDPDEWACTCGYATERTQEAIAHDGLGKIKGAAPEPGSKADRKLKKAARVQAEAEANASLEQDLYAALEKARAEGHAEGLAHAARFLDANADMAGKKADSYSTGSHTRSKWEAAEYALDQAGKELLRMSEGHA